jgi:hypothetical protein
MLTLTWVRALAWRVQRHYLDQRAPAGSMLAVASRLCGLHAQVMSSAELAVWARVKKLDRQAVWRALWEERTLVKTWAMRGTLHLLPASELSQWHAALGTRRMYLRPAQWQKHFGLTLEELDHLTHVIGKVLRDCVLTREKLIQEVIRFTGSADYGAKLGASSWGTTLKPAAFAGRLCFGPNLGQRVQFTSPDTWLPAVQRPVDPQEAIAAVTRSFLTAYGPATDHDLARWWSGGGVTTARHWIDSLGDDVTPVDLDGARAWMLTTDARKLRDIPPIRSVRLLPGFDPYVIGASYHAEQLLPGNLRHRVFRPQGWVSPVLLVNGRMLGIWRHELKGSRVEVTIEPFVKTPAWVRHAAGQEAERLAAFLGGDLSFAWKH